MEGKRFYFKKCYEIDPIVLKGQLPVITPFQRILRGFPYYPKLSLSNKKTYDRMVKEYYIYKNQYKKYGLTFPISYNNYQQEKILFLTQKSILTEKLLTPEFKILKYKDNDYFLLNDCLPNSSFEEILNKFYFEIGEYNPFDENIEFITLNDYHIQPKEDDLIYIDAVKLCKIEKPLSQILTKRELVNYERIKEIPFVFEYSKSYRYCTKKDKNFNSKNSSETITDIDDLLIKNVPLCFVEKNDFLQNVKYYV